MSEGRFSVALAVATSSSATTERRALGYWSCFIPSGSSNSDVSVEIRGANPPGSFTPPLKVWARAIEYDYPGLGSNYPGIGLTFTTFSDITGDVIVDVTVRQPGATFDANHGAKPAVFSGVTLNYYSVALAVATS